MKSFKYYLTEKSVEDTKFRTEATQFLSKLIAFIKKDKFENASKVQQFKGFAYPGIFIDAKYLDLLIIFSYGDKTFDVAGGAFLGGYGHLKSGMKVIVMDILKKPYDVTDLETRLQSGKNKSTWVHEFVHYMDEKRYKGSNEFVLKGTKAAMAGDFKGYINTPNEFNSYFQQGIVEVEDAIAGVPRSITKDKLKNMTEFKKWVMPLFDKTFISSLGNKYTNKFNKRLADYYDSLKKEYSD